jgi:hypothetical protein
MTDTAEQLLDTRASIPTLPCCLLGFLFFFFFFVFFVLLFFYIFYFFFFFLGVGTELRALHWPGKRSSTELNPQPHHAAFYNGLVVPGTGISR